ncbi:poly-beta-1,6-N-acetyl-D-glucosamine synthase [Silvimonas iriomotensis]|uniref:Poly-beta-1,6-N-acetyl-D-glucosamine synthase n=1 Tax=Silvimonas iriomotensis TaxID=449662 RepID=A0ABQ2PBP0_9NEIS|nr:poly-beta-1,6-N-acetyl-D-glucosamine synthase [Silvimonas iriomotensis]GGP22761.1 poly-beta-1,6 N-acetyl-D-glucosamine synthase [Silvimonas iriomotensis]
MNTLSALSTLLLQFAFFYPLTMAWMWMIGAVHYYWRFEKRLAGVQIPPILDHYPGVSLIVPMHNEGENARETIAQLMCQRYPTFEVIAVNDGSKDDTGAILDELSEQYPRLRVIHLATNQGKAMGLNTAALMAKYEFLICIDGDALLDEYAAAWFMQHFVHGPRLGAITGNPRIRNRSTLLGKLQVGEFSSIIGMIKRAQRTYGRIFTISGVVGAFRRAALHDVGYWSPEMLTEDIDISWKLQIAHWDIRYEPKACCWILMPETLKGLWKQRLRWAMGGVQVLIKYLPSLLFWRKRRMWAIYAEFLLSVAWAYIMGGVTLLWFLGLFMPLPQPLYIQTILPGWNGVVIGVTCLLQIGVALRLDSQYDEGMGKSYYWMVWYPLAYWLLNMLTTIWAVPKTLMRKRNSRAVWVSPDRGIQQTVQTPTPAAHEHYVSTKS